MEDGWRHVQRNGELKGTGEVAEGRADAESGKYHSVRIYKVRPLMPSSIVHCVFMHLN